MTLVKPKIVIFEDNPDNYEELRGPLENSLSELEEDIDFERFPPDIELDSSNLLQGLKEELRDPEYPLLVVLDYDLTGTEHVVQREHVRQACEEERIPLCIYHREEGTFEDRQRVQEYEEDVIKINPSKGAEEVAQDCAAIADGFWQLQTGIADAFEAYQESEDDEPVDALVPKLLKAPPSVRAKLDQYAWGNPEPLLGGTPSEESNDNKPMMRRWTTLLGYWIRNELLEFPGALLNPIATAAYLDVDHDQFTSDDQYQEPLSNAEYEGPFSRLGKWYWTPELDSIRAEQMEDDDSEIPLGPTLFERFGLPNIEQSTCQDAEEGGHKGARYYCVLMKKPVCKEHSKSPGGWIPMGATRSRVSQTEYHKYAPWML